MLPGTRNLLLPLYAGVNSSSSSSSASNARTALPTELAAASAAGLLTVASVGCGLLDAWAATREGASACRADDDDEEYEEEDDVLPVDARDCCTLRSARDDAVVDAAAEDAAADRSTRRASFLESPVLLTRWRAAAMPITAAPSSSSSSSSASSEKQSSPYPAAAEGATEAPEVDDRAAAPLAAAAGARRAEVADALLCELGARVVAMLLEFDVAGRLLAPLLTAALVAAGCVAVVVRWPPVGAAGEVTATIAADRAAERSSWPVTNTRARRAASESGLRVRFLPPEPPAATLRAACSRSRSSASTASSGNSMSMRSCHGRPFTTVPACNVTVEWKRWAQLRLHVHGAALGVADCTRTMVKRE